VASTTANDDSANSFVDTGPPPIEEWPSLSKQGSSCLGQQRLVVRNWQCLRAQYDALAAPIPPHMAELVEQLETKK